MWLADTDTLVNKLLQGIQGSLQCKQKSGAIYSLFLRHSTYILLATAYFLLGQVF